MSDSSQPDHPAAQGATITVDSAAQSMSQSELSGFPPEPVSTNSSPNTVNIDSHLDLSQAVAASAESIHMSAACEDLEAPCDKFRLTKDMSRLSFDPDRGNLEQEEVLDRLFSLVNHAGPANNSRSKLSDSGSEILNFTKEDVASQSFETGLSGYSDPGTTLNTKLKLKLPGNSSVGGY